MVSIPENQPLVGNCLLLSLIPHFKSDTENSYMIREYHVMIHYWFNPDEMETLLKVIENIEAWVVNDFEDKTIVYHIVTVVSTP